MKAHLFSEFRFNGSIYLDNVLRHTFDEKEYGDYELTYFYGTLDELIETIDLKKQIKYFLFGKIVNEYGCSECKFVFQFTRKGKGVSVDIVEPEIWLTTCGIRENGYVTFRRLILEDFVN